MNKEKCIYSLFLVNLSSSTKLFGLQKEKKESGAMDVTSALIKLGNNLKERRDAIFVSFADKKIMSTLKKYE